MQLVHHPEGCSIARGLQALLAGQCRLEKSLYQWEGKGKLLFKAREQRGRERHHGGPSAHGSTLLP